MSVSRSQSRKLEKKRKTRRMRRLLMLNLTMLAIIAALFVIYISMRPDEGRKQADGKGSPQTAADGTASGTGGGGADTVEPGGSSAGRGNGKQGAAAGPEENDKGSEDIGKGSEDTGSVVPDGGTSDSGAGPAAGVGGSGSVSGSGTDNVSGSGNESGSNSAAGGSLSGEGGKPITLSFVGDLLPAASVETLMEKYGYDYPYLKSLDFLQKPDLLAGNLETPVTDRGTPAENKQYVFKGSPKALPAMKEAGVDIVNLANNHTLDQGVEGLLDTIANLNKAGIPHMGAGNNEAEAYKPVVLEAGDVRVAYVGLTHVVPDGSWKAAANKPGLAETYDLTRPLKAIEEARQSADIVVVMVHWGKELADNPNDSQKRDAHAFIDAGADLVIGSHPHVLQGFEKYKGKWISYSLGNYIFNITKTDRTKDTGVLDAVCNKQGSCKLQFHPMRAEASQPAPLEGEQAKTLLQRLSGLSFNAKVDNEGYVN